MGYGFCRQGDTRLHQIQRAIPHIIFSLSLQAVVPAMSDWISILVTKPSKLEPVGPRLDPIFQIVRLPTLVSAELVETLICSLIPYLDSQQKWHDYAQHGLSSFLYALHGSMWLPDEGYAPLYGIGVMSQASRLLLQYNLATFIARLGRCRVACMLLACCCLLADKRLCSNCRVIL